MEIKDMNLSEVIERMSALDEEVRSMEAIEDIDKATEEKKALLERKAELEELEARKQTALNIQEHKVDPVVVEARKESKKMITNGTKEYRIAWLKNLRNEEITVEERAALTTAGTPIPEDLQNEILTKVRDYAPVLQDVELLHAGEYVKFAVEDTVIAAADHTENAAITPDSDTFTYVTLTATEITKMLQISESAKVMSIGAFETWVVNHISEAIAQKIEAKVFGTMLAGSASVATVTAGSITTANIYALFAALKSGYARNGKVYMSRATLYGNIIGLQDKAKNDLVIREGNTYKLLGVEIEETPSLATGVVIFCDPRKFVANMPENIQMRQQYDIDTNSYKYLGVAMYDGKVAISEAFQALTV